MKQIKKTLFIVLTIIMMAFCILNWHFQYEDLSLVLDEEGYPLLFDSRKEAQEYAEENLNFEWKVVGLD